jgi:phage terminase large subunit-like protein
MSIFDELIVYAKQCISGEIISCQKHKWACRRFLDDVQKAKGDWQYYWDENEAEKIVSWFSYLRHCKGILAGKPIILTTSQKFSLCQIYGWRRKKDDYRRFKISFKEVARKNAKTQEEAGVVLYEIATQSVKYNEILETYCAGTKRDQSKLLFNECKNMLMGSPLRKKFKITKTEIVHIKTNSFLKPLSKEDGQKGDGTNPAVLVLDEYHQHPTSEFYDLGLGSQTKQPLLMIITTAGIDLNVPCYTQEYKYADSLLDPNCDIENDEYFADIFELDKDDNIDDIKNWHKANPIRMSYAEGIEKIRLDYGVAKDVPEKMTAFKTKMLNVWVQQTENGYMDMAKWKSCEVEHIPLTEKAICYVGFDMSAKIDLTSVAFVVPMKTGEFVQYAVWSHSFIPNNEKLSERIKVDKMPYQSWVDNGYITVTDTPIVDQRAVIDYVLAFCKKMNFHIEMFCFDPANASKMMMELSDMGYSVVEVYQSHKSLNEATAGFREQVYCGNILYEKNPVLNYAMKNAVIRTNRGLIKIDKDAAKNRIDPVDALLAGFKLAMYHVFYDSGYVDKWLEEE